MPPKIAYFIMVHHKPEQFGWLMDAIANPQDLFFVHVDLKSRLGIKADRRGVMAGVRRILADVPNAVLLPSRYTNWGGWSLSQILLDAIRIALARDASWTHFVNLSGQCYPLKPVETVRALLGRSGDRVHVEMLPIADLPFDDWHHRAIRMFETPVRAHILKGVQKDPKSFSIRHKGSQWVMLPRSFCSWATTAPIMNDIRRYLRRRLLSDELTIQTLVANGPFRDRVVPFYGRAIVWPGPKVLTREDWTWLQASPALFGRKFDTSVDAEILRMLACAVGRPTMQHDERRLSKLSKV